MDKNQVLVLDGDSLTIGCVVRVSRHRQPVTLAAAALERVQRARDLVERMVEQSRVVYGITTGFGNFSHVVISRDQAVELQRNLVTSHAAAVGQPFGEDVVRAVMLLRANALAKGHSGVRPVVIQTLCEMLNRGVHPVIPAQGSLGASGDLAPLSHLALVLMGRGEALFNGCMLTGEEALAQAGLQPLELKEKEGLALINGTQVMAAIGALAVEDCRNLLKVADIVGAMSLEALGGLTDAFDPAISRVRPHPGQACTAQNLSLLVDGSDYLRREPSRVQDAYSLRCMPQVHGAAKDAFNYTSRVMGIEINAATDNPLVFAEEERVLSGGNFHGQPLALAMDFLCMAMAEIASISERRIERLINPALNGLPAFLVKEGGLNSGFMIAQYTAASLVSENKVLSHPACVDSIPSSANQEDHVSMGATSARKLRQVIGNVANVLAIELLAAAQALEFAPGSAKGRGTGAAYQAIRALVPHLDQDRELYPDIRQAASLIISGKLVQWVEEKVGLAV